jgi:hypothetical protein
VLTAGLRFNKTLPLNVHNIMSLGYVDTIPIGMFYPPGSPALKSEHAARFNTFLDVAPMALLQPVIQYYTKVGGGAARRGLGFRTKLDL